MLCKISLYYQLLHLEVDASPAEVRAAYLRRSLATHPDKKGGCDEQFRQVRRDSDHPPLALDSSS
jgi:curved DNA-binding protein CbpA